MKRVIKLTESDLHRIIAETVKSAINEIGDTPMGQHALGQAAGRRFKRWSDSAHDGSPADLDSLDVMYDLENHAMKRASDPRNPRQYPTTEFNRGFGKEHRGID